LLPLSRADDLIQAHGDDSVIAPLGGTGYAAIWILATWSCLNVARSIKLATSIAAWTALRLFI